jgi:sortase (surface protein transpeptidase)
MGQEGRATGEGPSVQETGVREASEGLTGVAKSVWEGERGRHSITAHHTIP